MSNFNISDELKRILKAGVGATAITIEKAEQIIDYCVEKGDLTIEQGKSLNEELKHNVKDAYEKTSDKFKKEAKPKFDDFVDNLDEFSEEQIAKLKEKLASMDKKDDDAE